MAEVDMAQNEMFSGAVAESVPTSTTGFLHRRERADSTTSFAYYNEDEEEEGDSDSWMEEEAIIDDEIDGEAEDEDDEQEGRRDQDSSGEHSFDLEAGQGRRPSKRRKSSGLSRTSRISRGSETSHISARQPLLRRNNSGGSNMSNVSGRGMCDRQNQKLYILSEDLTIVIAGFSTSIIGYAVYITICIITAGLGYLLFRWLPRWRIRITGIAKPLRECSWVVIEVSQYLVFSQIHLTPA